MEESCWPQALMAETPCSRVKTGVRRCLEAESRTESQTATGGRTGWRTRAADSGCDWWQDENGGFTADSRGSAQRPDWIADCDRWPDWTRDVDCGCGLRPAARRERRIHNDSRGSARRRRRGPCASEQKKNGGNTGTTRRKTREREKTRIGAAAGVRRISGPTEGRTWGGEEVGSSNGDLLEE